MTNNAIPPELIKSLDAMTSMVKNVLDDIRDHSVSLAIVKTKLEDITSNVESLSHILKDDNGQTSVITRLALVQREVEAIKKMSYGVRESNVSIDNQGSINTRLALLEKTSEDLEEQINEVKERSIVSIQELKKLLAPKNATEEDKRLLREKQIAKYQLIGAALAGFAALALQIFGMIHK